MKCNFIWQTGANYAVPSALPVNIRAFEFIDDMPSAYNCADLVVCRSGATTVAELCVVKKPSILIPMPSASNNEQFHNAKSMADARASIILNNKSVKKELFPIIREFFSNTQQLKFMSNSAGHLSKPNAATDIATQIIKDLT